MVVVERGGRIGAPGCKRDGGGKRKGSRKKRGEGKGGTRLRRKVETEVVVAPVPGPFLPPSSSLLAFADQLTAVEVRGGIDKWGGEDIGEGGGVGGRAGGGGGKKSC